MDLELADLDFGTPCSIDILLGAEIFSRTVLYGQQFGPLGTPSAFKTTFGWVLAGTINGIKSKQILRQFEEVEDHNYRQPVLSSEEQVVVKHFEKTHSCNELGRFIIPLPIKPDVTPLGDLRTSVVKRFESFERSLRASLNLSNFKSGT